jgi:uncharacterized damage-inducible protein DinB
MRAASHHRKSFAGRVAPMLIVAGLGLALSSAPAQAQDLNEDSAATLKAAFMADIEVMRGKFLGLAEAFPAETYTWRPMEGVRSVSEVLMLIASEGYGFVPMSVGAPTAMSREESQALNEITDKAEVIDHLNRGFDYAREQLEALDPATLTGARNLFGQERSSPAIMFLVGGDMHEHLGQLIAYARTNEIVPPWSR